MSSATLQPVPVRAVLVDVHGTLVTPRHGGKTDLLRDVIRAVTEHLVDGKRARRFTNIIRRELIAARPEEYLNTDPYWMEVNCEMMRRAFGIVITDAQALDIHHRMVWGEYKMHPKRRAFVHWLLKTRFGRVPHVVVASNSQEAAVRRTLEAEGVASLFRDVYTSEKLKVSKPAPSFWGKVLRQLEVQPHETLMVGNSMLNDAVAARHGIHTVLILDRFDEAEAREAKRSQLDEYAAERKGEVRVFASEHLQRVREYIARNFQAAA